MPSQAFKQEPDSNKMCQVGKLQSRFEITASERPDIVRERIDLYTSCITGTVYTKLHRLS